MEPSAFPIILLAPFETTVARVTEAGPGWPVPPSVSERK